MWNQYLSIINKRKGEIEINQTIEKFRDRKKKKKKKEQSIEEKRKKAKDHTFQLKAFLHSDLPIPFALFRLANIPP